MFKVFLNFIFKGLFNLALMIEFGYQIPNDVMQKIGVKQQTSSSNYTQLISLYEK